MVFLAYAGSVALYLIQSVLCKKSGKSDDPVVFNINKGLTATVMFLLIGIFSFRFHLPTLLYGLAYGVFFSVSMWTGLKALSSGPLALSTMIISFSLILPTLYGVLFLHETVAVPGIIGFVLLAVSFVLINLKSLLSGKGRGERANWKWFAYTVTTLCSDGLCAIVKKAHQTAYPNQYKTEIMCIALAVVTLTFTLIYLCRKKPEGGVSLRSLVNWRGMICGMANGGSSYLTLYLMAMENVSVQAPVIAALNAIASLAAGWLIFRERLTLTQLLGFLAGLASVVLLKL